MNIMSEIALILVICLAGEAVAALLPVAFPASVISMVLLMILLLCGAVKQRQIQLVADFFVVNMGLFFVPALVGILAYVDVLKRLLLPFVVVVALTTPVVYLVTGWTVQLLMQRMQKKGGGRDV